MKPAKPSKPTCSRCGKIVTVWTPGLTDKNNQRICNQCLMLNEWVIQFNEQQRKDLNDPEITN